MSRTQDLVRRGAVGEGREQLLPFEDGARALGGREVAEDLANHWLAPEADPLERRLGMLRQRAFHTADLPVRLTCQELSFLVAACPEARDREGQERQRPPRSLDGADHVVHESVVLEAVALPGCRFDHRPPSAPRA